MNNRQQTIAKTPHDWFLLTSLVTNLQSEITALVVSMLTFKILCCWDFLKIHKIISPSSELSLHFLGTSLKSLLIVSLFTLIYTSVSSSKPGVAGGELQLRLTHV